MDGYEPKDIADGDKTGLFVHYQAKLCVWKVKDVLVENFAKKV
jgi:hypothetical protein